ncbi:hypothetical protein [Paracoccus sp. SM22M-07]|uniref:hypothetical protein n=1 Tax=Paracoccus sp. SM22M-07 TaxID=1520813 RepID=UPI000A68B4B4|nr:hypothetical protein [Paracoccus sp. SM22M-07]
MMRFGWRTFGSVWGGLMGSVAPPPTPATIAEMYGIGPGQVPLRAKVSTAVMSGENIVRVPNAGGAGSAFDMIAGTSAITITDGAADLMPDEYFRFGTSAATPPDLMDTTVFMRAKLRSVAVDQYFFGQGSPQTDIYLKAGGAQMVFNRRSEVTNQFETVTIPLSPAVEAVERSYEISVDPAGPITVVVEGQLRGTGTHPGWPSLRVWNFASGRNPVNANGLNALVKDVLSLRRGGNHDANRAVIRAEWAALYTAAPVAPEISITSGGGYAGSTYTSTVAGQWTANDVDILGETGASWTMTREYEGAVIRCGGSNAIRMWMPTDLDAGLKVVWADPKRQQSAGTGFVSQLADQFGTNDFVQSSPSLRPVANTEGGDPFISFNSGTYLESTTAIATPYIAFVSRYKTGVEAAFDTYQVLIGDTGGHRVQGDGFNATQWNSGPLRKNGGASSLVALPMPKSLFMGVPARAATVAKIWLGSTAPRWNGGLWEFIALSAMPTEADRLILEGCMAHRNGIAASLPSGHPYKLTGPQVAVAAPATEEWAMAAGDGSVTIESSPSDPEPAATAGDGSITTG